jgi:hypothetical protein
MSPIEARNAALDAVRAAAKEALAAGELAIFFGELERVRVEVLMAATASVQPATSASNADRLLSVEQVAARIGRSRWWVYTNKDALPIVRFPTGRYGFSERGLERWIERRRSA